ncbi:hypothetical protein BHE74_00009371 [Ensete ventricosum]|uniref:Protein FAR1-RELATED SEQUENCE n=1 Tax=Ensete ventricosum TaxID=4639 RepID=A0A427BAZ2_ENSVE|nr:hypothetical protein B296_00008647 [Ensete ventricosum]RWW32003.1 hypothetical protein GW17_00003337 [Ensete ventricosum]RWW82189.1 hypothetical protein BHE74_00009371 [Ensete ventricosum]RZR78964.1 hypothetical protein BHM03_00004526 [Ensete ventricosum]
MLFDSESDAYEFYNTYAENEGFIVRRSSSTVSAKNIITKRTFVCSREGFREKKKGEREVKCPRAVTRIGCPACMTIRLTPTGKYCVTEFVPNHNHQLATVATFDKLRAKKLRRNARVARAGLVDDTVRIPEFETEDEAYEFYNNKWVAKLFEEREKWALVYGRETFYADMKSVQQKESISTELKKYLGNGRELPSFFEHYERILSQRRHAELQDDFDANQSTQKPPSMRMLRQAANAYTPAAYRMFEREFELYMDCILLSCNEFGTLSEYKVMVEEKPKVHVVKCDTLDSSMSCSCKKFEFLGIQCCHVLKVLDTQNIKELPPQYILKRWRKDAKTRNLNEDFAFPFDGDPQLSLANRHSYLCRIFSIAAAHAAKTIDSYTFLESHSEALSNQLEQVLHTSSLEMPAVISASCDRLQNPVETVVTESVR